MSDNSNLVIDALNKTDPELAKRIDADNSWKSGLVRSGARVALYREYEIGDHRADMTDQMRKMLRLKTGDDELTEFNDNYMEVVIDMEASRLFVSSITGDDASQGWVEETLERNRFISEHGQWCRGAIRDGDAYVMVDLNANWISVPAYDGFSGLVVIYSGDTNKAIWACKLWSEANNEDDASNVTMKLVVYQADKISYFEGSENGAGVTATDEPKPWLLDDLPIVPFMNKKDTYADGGRSELRPAIPLQDVLNRSLHSLVMAFELSAFGVKYSIGMEISLDGIVPGGVVGLVIKDSAGNVMTELTDAQLDFLKSVSVGQFDATDVTQYLQVLDKIVQQLGQVTQTPIRGVASSNQISGEALRQLEIGLLGKVKRFQWQNTNAFMDLLNLTADIQNAYDTGKGSAPELGAVKIAWKDAELLDINARITALKDLRADSPGLFSDDFYIEQIGSLLELSQADINDQKEAVAEQQGREWDRLTGAGGEIPAV